MNRHWPESKRESGPQQRRLSEHINNILSSGELDDTSIGFSDKSSGGRKPKIYNRDMILSVGYRVNSKRGIAFRKWANRILNGNIASTYVETVFLELHSAQDEIDKLLSNDATLFAKVFKKYI